jgi:hypothetical protein
MRTKRKEPVRLEEQVVDGPTICDGCGKPIDESPNGYEQNEVKIEARIGSVWPGGTSRTVHESDVCVDCFTTKVLPTLEAAGIKMRERHEDDDGRVWEDSVNMPLFEEPKTDPIF